MRWRMVTGLLGVGGAGGVVVYLALHGLLPTPAQKVADGLLGRGSVERAGGGRAGTGSGGATPLVADRAVAGGGEDAVAPPPTRGVPGEMPRGAFVPLALLHEPGRTHLVYLARGRPRHAKTEGLITFFAPVYGVSRLWIEPVDAPFVGPEGSKVRTRRRSRVDQLRRMDYRTGKVVLLQPATVRGIRLSAEDLGAGSGSSRYTLRETRSILAIFDGDAVLEVRRELFLGGAHPATRVGTERVGLLVGVLLQPRFSKEDSSSAALAWRRRVGPEACLREHEGSVALRGPGGIPVPAALMGGALEACRDRLGFQTDRGMLDALSRKGISLGPYARFARGAVYLGEIPLSDDAADVIPLAGVPAVLVVEGAPFEPPIPGARTRRARPLRFLPLIRGARATTLARVRPLIGSVALAPDLLTGEDRRALAKIFHVKVRAGSGH